MRRIDPEKLLGGLIRTMLAVSILACLSIAGRIVYIEIDANGPQSSEVGIVKATRFAPEDSTPKFNPAMKTHLPTRLQDEWYLTVSVRDQTEEIKVEEDIYRSLRQDDRVNVIVQTGQLSGKIKILGLAN